MQSKRLVFASLLCALSFVFMYIGNLTGVFDLCAVVVGAVCTIFAAIEMGGAWPWLVFAVTGVLCALLLPDKFIAMEYIALGGLYPILKAFFEKLPKIPSWAVKIVSFNIMLAACLALAKFVLGMQEEYIAFDIIVFAAGNVFFVIYDIALTVFIAYYFQYIRSKLKIRLK